LSAGQHSRLIALDGAFAGRWLEKANRLSSRHTPDSQYR